MALPTPTVIEIPTPVGVAGVEIHRPAAVDPHGWLLLGHGAGGGVGAPDLVAAATAGLAHGLAVGLVLQPYRVAGRRAPAPAAQLDRAWVSVATALRSSDLSGPLVVGGRSSGARVACRTAEELAADAVLCLAFPLHPPGKPEPEKSRLPELEAVPASTPVLVIQGERDPFGQPPEGPGRQVVPVAGTHSLRAAGPVEAAVSAWLTAVLGSPEEPIGPAGSPNLST